MTVASRVPPGRLFSDYYALRDPKGDQPRPALYYSM